MMIKTKYKYLIIITPLVVIVDQITKLMILHWLEIGCRIPVIPGFFDIVHFRNTGAAFGMFSEIPDSVRVPFFYLIAIAVVVLLAFFYKSIRDDERMLPLGIALVFGGIVGNVLDRIRLGSVVDFLCFHIGERSIQFTFLGKFRDVPLEWPAFNVADSAITVAMFLLVISAFKRRD